MQLLLSLNTLVYPMTSMLTRAKICIKFALRDIQCGYHSGFRPCCIFCYSILDNLSTLDKRRFSNGRRYVQRVFSRLRKLHFGYIPCPICLFRKPVKVLRCKPHDESHWLNFLTDEEVEIFNNLKEQYPLHDGLQRVDNYLDKILGERDELLRWY